MYNLWKHMNTNYIILIYKYQIYINNNNFKQQIWICKI